MISHLALYAHCRQCLFFFFTNVGKHLATRKRQDRQIVDTDSRSGYSFDPVNYKEYKTLMSIQPFCTFCRNHVYFQQQVFFVNAGKHVTTRNRPDGKTEILDPDTCSGYYTQFRALKGIHTRFVDRSDDIRNRCKLGPMWSFDNPDNAMQACKVTRSKSECQDGCIKINCQV